MALTINLYNCSDDPKTVTKSNKTLLLTTNAELYDDTDLENPTLKLGWIDYTTICKANYLYVTEFDKYYFVMDRKTGTGGAMYITCAEDYLSTFDAQIRSLPGVMVRNSNKYQEGSKRSTWIQDSKLPIQLGREIKCIEFSGSSLNIDTAGAQSDNFVLNVAGHGVIDFEDPNNGGG